METNPAPLDALNGSHAALAKFRVAAPREIASMLRQLCDGNVPVNLNASDGVVCTTTLWTLDADRGQISFVADVTDTRMQALLECDEVTVVGYLDNVKVQFEVSDLVLVRGNRASVLSCASADSTQRCSLGRFSIERYVSNAWRASDARPRCCSDRPRP